MDRQGQEVEEEVKGTEEEVGSSFRQDFRVEEASGDPRGQGASGFSIGLDRKLTGFLDRNVGEGHQPYGGSVVYL